MSNFYRFLQISMTPIVRTFFGEIKTNNYDKLPIGEPIIFVANHPSALMDPLICGAFVEKPIYFLGRADIFKSKFNNWFLVFYQYVQEWSFNSYFLTKLCED